MPRNGEFEQRKIPLKYDPNNKYSISVKTVKPVLVKFAKHSTFDTFSFCLLYIHSSLQLFRSISCLYNSPE